MGACCCRRSVSVETQTFYVGKAHDCTHMDAINEDHCCVDQEDYRVSSSRNPKIFQIENNLLGIASKSNGPINSDLLEKRFLDEHNHYRELHGCPPLTINHSLSILAKEWAWHLSTKDTIQYRSDPKFGENIYKCTTEPIDPSEIVKSWYDEIQYYKFDEDIRSENTGHFTQVIWKNTKELGIGIEQLDNTIWIVAFYSPPGNYLRQFNENVPPQKGGIIVSIS